MMSSLPPSFGSHLKSVDQRIGCGSMSNLSFIPSRVGRVQFRTTRLSLTVHAGYRPSSGSIFVGGFVLGGLIFGTLGCVYAPQISKAIVGTEKKKLMEKASISVYDEEKQWRTGKIMAEKIAQMNIAIDDASAQVRSEDSSNSDEIEAAG